MLIARRRRRFVCFSTDVTSFHVFSQIITMKNLSVPAVSILLLATGLGEFSHAAENEKLPKTIRFNDHIRPIFTAHCTACHGGVKQAGEVSFVYREQVLPPDGWIVEPGDPEASILIERVIEKDPDLRMPPPDHGPALSKREIALLTEWIRQGAPWEASHWAYAKPQSSPLPKVNDATWQRGPIDQLVLARLESEGLRPSDDASPERWLRRVTLDLTGLPPTLEECDKFLSRFANDPDAARRDAVDRLLDSPAFGERWASVWLDQIRYADSKGLGLDGRRSIWKFRDWVIQAFNDDMPYDDFTVKQIAGDLLPNPSVSDLIATAAHRTTQSNEEGGTDDEEFRIGAVLDRVNTTWQAWQGVTFGCVQCHSHPYDPFRNEEYYQFAAFFNNTRDCDLNEDWPTINAPLDTDQYPEATRLDQEITSLRESIWENEFQLLADSDSWKPLVDLKASTNTATKVDVERSEDHDEFFTVDTVSRNTDITLEAPLPDDLQTLTAIRLTVMPLDPETAVRDSEWGFVLSHLDAKLLVDGNEEPQPITLKHVVIDEPHPFYDPLESLQSKSNRGFSAYTRIHYPRQAAFVLQSPLEIPDGAKLQVTLKHRVYILASFTLLSRRGHLAVTDDSRWTELLDDESLNAKKQELAELKKQRSAIKSVSVPILQDRQQNLSRPTHVFQRGLFLDKTDRVQPQTPKTLHPLEETASGETPNRMTLARWLVSPDNPLTARVAVNRVWARLFGIGLVATEEDFGSSGEAPSHPQLLDYLALRFQNELDMSVKSLLREIVLSRTYGQTSAVTPELHERDPQNRLLARGPRFRLPAEMVRDQALALSGLLSDKQFGPPVYPPIPDGVWDPFQGGDKWNVAKPDDENRYRRSIYTYMKRSIPYPMFAAFDAPSREFCTPRRLRSNTPIQALMMLNDTTFAECANGLAERMSTAGTEPSEQLRHGFRIVTCREPSQSELDELLQLYEKTAQDGETLDLSFVAGVLLNLDEVLMK